MPLTLRARSDDGHRRAAPARSLLDRAQERLTFVGDRGLDREFGPCLGGGNPNRSQRDAIGEDGLSCSCGTAWHARGKRST
jgi:hypothetical protein